MNVRQLANKKTWLEIIKYNQDFILVNLLLICKVLFSSKELGFGLGPTDMVFSSLAILLVLSCWIFFLPYKARASALIIIDAVLSFVLLADVVFFRFFHHVISIPALFEASMVEGVTGSVGNLFSISDIFYFIDIILLIPYFFILNHRHIREPQRLLNRMSKVGGILIVCLLFLAGTAKAVSADFSVNAYTGLNLNNTVLKNMGIFNFHLFDLYNFIKQKDATVSLNGEVPQLKQWMSQNREQEPAKYYGVAKGKNLILVQLEAMQGFVIGASVNGQEITPNLNDLIKHSMYFNNYFTQIAQGNTSDAEFATLNSLYPAATGSNYIMKSKNTYQSLPWLFKEQGYGTYAFHGNKAEFWNRNNMYPAEGFDDFYNLSNGLTLDENVIMGLSDESMFRQSMQIMQSLQQPFFSFMITLSGHYPYNVPDYLKGLNIPNGQFSPIFTDYLQAQHYADSSLGDFIADLKQSGLWDNSVVVFYGDHFGTGWTNQDLEKFLQASQPLNDYNLHELNKVPLIIHFPGDQHAGVVHTSGGQMDLFPTLANLFALNTNNMFYFGRDLLNSQHSFTAFRYYSPDGSFVTNKLFYIAGSDGVFEHGKAYDRQTGQQVPVSEAKAGYQEALWQEKMSDLILDTNGLPLLIPHMH